MKIELGGGRDWSGDPYQYRDAEAKTKIGLLDQCPDAPHSLGFYAFSRDFVEPAFIIHLWWRHYTGNQCSLEGDELSFLRCARLVLANRYGRQKYNPRQEGAEYTKAAANQCELDTNARTGADKPSKHGAL